MGCQCNFLGFASWFPMAWPWSSSCWRDYTSSHNPTALTCSLLYSHLLPPPFPLPLVHDEEQIPGNSFIWTCGLLLLASSNKQERGRERGKLVNTMLYLNKQSQMASFLPSASDKKRLNRKNKQQLTSHTQNWDQQGAQIPALCTVLSHGSAPNPETCLASSAFGGAFSYGVSESWKHTGQVFFLLNLIFSLLRKTMA